MALIKCRECKKKVSSEASVCPNCGITDPDKKEKHKFTFGSTGYIGILLLAIIIYTMLFGGDDDQPKSSSDEFNQDISTPISPSTDFLTDLEKDSATLSDLFYAVSDQRKKEMLRLFFANHSAHNCIKVSEVYFNGLDSEESTYWSVTCDISKNYLIQFENKSIDTARFRAMTCETAKAINTPCFTKF